MLFYRTLISIGVVLFSTATWSQVSSQKYFFNPNLTYEFVESSNRYDPYIGFEYPSLFTFGYNYVEKPFVLKDQTTNQILTSVVRSIDSYQFGYQKSIFDPKLSVGLRGGINQAYIEYDPTDEVFLDKKITSLSDSFINFKFKTSESEHWLSSFVFDIGLGTGNKRYYQSDGASISLNGVLEYLQDTVRLSTNLGYKITPQAKFGTVNESQKLLTALGGFWQTGRTWGMTLEGKKDFILNSSTSGSDEVRFGLQKKLINEGLTLFLSAGSSNLKDYSTTGQINEYSLSLGFKYAPEFMTAQNKTIESSKMSLNSNSEYQKRYAHKIDSKKAKENRLAFQNPENIINSKPTRMIASEVPVKYKTDNYCEVSNQIVQILKHNMLFVDESENIDFENRKELLKLQDLLKEESVTETKLLIALADDHDYELFEKRYKSIEDSLLELGIHHRIKILKSLNQIQDEVAPELTESYHFSNTHVMFRVFSKVSLSSCIQD